ncbi:hypothetical protein EAD98_23810 [Micromonospora sp. CV4]|nr:hypothetical protein EAD98_23810 [Micromonospora sp. CV4]
MRRLKRLATGLLSAAAVLSTSVVAVQPAAAAAAATVSRVEQVSLDVTQCNRTNHHIYVVRGAQTGGSMCGPGYFLVNAYWSDGHQETFIIGWDQAVWQTYSNPARTTWIPWRSMGGGFIAGLDTRNPLNPLTIRGYGLNGKRYCKTYTGVSPGWPTNWSLCDPLSS